MVLIDVEASLRSAGYRCKLSPYDSAMLLFEDEAIFGFVILFDTASQLVSLWREKQTTFIQKNAGVLRRPTMKAWNCYAVFLASQPADEAERRAMADVEEDLSLTRKLVGDSVTTLRDVQRILLPILPIQNLAVAPSATSLDLAARLETWSSQAIRALEGKANAEELINVLWDTQ